MWNNETFEEVVDKLTLSGVFTGTGVDEATQSALLEWFFNYPICDEDEDTWLRYFRRRCKNVYPLYENRIRISAVKGTMDPFIVDFLERSKNDRETNSLTTNGSKLSQSNGYRGTHTITEDETKRTPDLTTTTTSSGTRTPNLTTTLNEQGTTGNTQTTLGEVEETRNLASTEDSEVTDNSKQRSFAVNYPEANLSGIPTDVDSYPASIDYVNSEADTLGKTVTEGDVDRTDTGTVTTGTDTTVTDSGTSSRTSTQQSIGTETTSGTNEVQETGLDKTEFSGDTSVSEDSNGTVSDTTSGTETGSRAGESQEIEQGRHESVADILPRALAAISDSNDLIWLCDQLKPCFDIYATI